MATRQEVRRKKKKKMREACNKETSRYSPKYPGNLEFYPNISQKPKKKTFFWISQS